MSDKMSGIDKGTQAIKESELKAKEDHLRQNLIKQHGDTKLNARDATAAKFRETIKKQLFEEKLRT